MVEGWTQEQRRHCLAKFYRMRRGVVLDGRVDGGVDGGVLDGKSVSAEGALDEGKAVSEDVSNGGGGEQEKRDGKYEYMTDDEL